MTETFCGILAAAVLAPMLLGGAPTDQQRPRARDLGAPFDGTPLRPHQFERLARRVSPGPARTGALLGHGSGDILIAFSTANPGANNRRVLGAPRDRLRDVLRKYNRLVNPAS